MNIVQELLNIEKIKIATATQEELEYYLNNSNLILDYLDSCTQGDIEKIREEYKNKGGKIFL